MSDNGKMYDPERLLYIEMLRAEAFEMIPGGAWRFENAGVITESLEKTRIFVENFENFQNEDIGLILIGAPGTGKTYAAGCVANVLLDKGDSVMFVRVSDVVNHLQCCYGDDRDKYFRRLMSPDLLILDDLGAERDTSFAQGCVLDVIEHRIYTGSPMIITTNIPLVELKNPPDQYKSRIYGRIMANCAPIVFEEDNFRQKIANEKQKKAADIIHNTNKEENKWRE